jgi:hypothetical protein
MKRSILLTIAALSLSVLTPKTALAGRAVLNQTTETMQREFGRPWTILTVPGKTNTKIYTYSPAGIRQVMPTLPKSAKFGMVFVNNRVQKIWLAPNPADGVSYSYDPQQFFTYIFGYAPPTWKDLQYSLGHEGFASNRGCFGDGVVAAYMESNAGTGTVTMAYDRICEPSYAHIPPAVPGGQPLGDLSIWE